MNLEMNPIYERRIKLACTASCMYHLSYRTELKGRAKKCQALKYVNTKLDVQEVGYIKHQPFFELFSVSVYTISCLSNPYNQNINNLA